MPCLVQYEVSSNNVETHLLFASVADKNIAHELGTIAPRLCVKRQGLREVTSFASWWQNWIRIQVCLTLELKVLDHICRCFPSFVVKKHWVDKIPNWQSLDFQIHPPQFYVTLY